MAPAPAEAGASGADPLLRGVRSAGSTSAPGRCPPAAAAAGLLEGAPASRQRSGPSRSGWDATRYSNGIGGHTRAVGLVLIRCLSGSFALLAVKLRLGKDVNRPARAAGRHCAGVLGRRRVSR